MNPRDLPVWQLHFDILRALRDGNQLVLVAATGSGKTTQVPQMLLDGGIAGDKRIVILQPRRVAARTVSARVAWERGGRLGAEVGYQIRFEDRTSLGTRICYVTEGILLRWLQDDPGLRDIGVLIFDEFHERNLLSDVALALAKRLQRTTRPDLKLLVMSATLEAGPVAAYLAADPQSAVRNPQSAAPILESAGRTFPVEVQWADYGDQRPVTEQAADAVQHILRGGEPGDILVFMPGMGEINGTINALRATHLGERCQFLPLHGDLPPEDQDRAFQTFEARKIVVATNVAETSVTIDGVRHVVDAGLARVARYDAERGIQTLGLEKISRASADQRAGRAGRTAPGTCWRLWTESGHLDRPAKNTPEIQRADLAEVVLLLHSLGIRHAATFDWLDQPDPAAVERAERLLVTLGALTPPANGPTDLDIGSLGLGHSDLTDIGRQMLRLPMHPRYSRMLVEASRRGCVPAAALCAALTSGRDLLVRVGREESHIKEARELFEGGNASDFHTLMRAFQFAKNAGFDVNQCRRHGIRLIPQFMCLGHQSWAKTTFPLLLQYPELDETPQIPLDNPDIYCRSWCPLHPKVNAIVTFLPEQALKAARALDARLARARSARPPGALAGLPIAYKDMIATQGIRTTYGSPIYRDHVPAEDHVLVERLRAAGAITLGKTNTPEFAAGSQTFNPVFGATLNPYDLAKTCGGSSGGAAVAVACGMLPFADGSDLGASLRNPGNFCNVVGFRPTPGRTPYYPTGDAWATLSVIGIVFGALAALVQNDVKKLVAYSSVSHLGFCMLGLFALNVEGITGGVLQMINHGLSTGGLFLIVGMVYDRYHTRKLDQIGGLAAREIGRESNRG